MDNNSNGDLGWGIILAVLTVIVIIIVILTSPSDSESLTLHPTPTMATPYFLPAVFQGSDLTVTPTITRRSPPTPPIPTPTDTVRPTPGAAGG